MEDVTQRPVRLSWFVRMDPQIEEALGSPDHVVASHPALFTDIAARGDAVGLHIHAWRRVDGAWVDDFADPSWLGDCIDRSFAAFEATFGRPCRLTRIGSRFHDETVFRRLVAHEVAVDLSLEPAQHAIADGGLPHLRGDLADTRRAPRRPHRPVPGLVELPLTAGRKDLGRDLRAHLSRLRRHGLRERLDHPLPIWRDEGGSDAFGRQVHRSLAAQRRPYLAFALRSDSLGHDVQAPRLRANLAAIGRLAESSSFDVTTPEDAVAALGR